jgi:hypothetical protein
MLAPMDANAIIRRLEAFPRGLVPIVERLTDAESRWKPPDGAWSVLEIVCHLGDEEVDDFRARLFSTLKDPSTPWKPSDPEAWAREKRYGEQELRPALQRFVSERAESVRMLRGLGDLSRVDWNIAYQHPKVGPVYAGELLASWVGHDALHMRQIAKRLWELAARDGQPYLTKYAGEWKA